MNNHLKFLNNRIAYLTRVSRLVKYFVYDITQLSRRTRVGLVKLQQTSSRLPTKSRRTRSVKSLLPEVVTHKQPEEWFTLKQLVDHYQTVPHNRIEFVRQKFYKFQMTNFVSINLKNFIAYVIFFIKIFIHIFVVLFLTMAE